MKIGIVVPFSWSFWGAVVEHAELQAAALGARGHEVQLLMGNDPPGQFTRALHPRVGRHGDPPANVTPVGRSVIVPANGSLPNIVLSPRSFFRIRRVLERERFDVLHLHEPMTPAICIAVLALAKTPIVATFHASGELGHQVLRRAVRQPEEDEVEPVARLGVELVEVQGGIRRPEARVQIGHPSTGLRVGGGHAHVELRVLAAQPQQLRSGVAGGADDADGGHRPRIRLNA